MSSDDYVMSSDNRTVKERQAFGKSLRKQVPRRSHNKWPTEPPRSCPIDLLEEQNEDRIDWLIPVRRARIDGKYRIKSEPPLLVPLRELGEKFSVLSGNLISESFEQFTFVNSCSAVSASESSQCPATISIYGSLSVCRHPAQLLWYADAICFDVMKLAPRFRAANRGRTSRRSLSRNQRQKLLI